MKKYEDYIVGVIEEKQFILGQEINSLLVECFGIKKDNAKKIVQRAVKKGVISSSAPLTLGKGQYAYLPPNTKLSRSAFYQITKIHRPSLYRLMLQVENNGGVVSYYDALRVTGAPLKKGVSKVKTLNELINELEHLEWIIKEKGYNDIDYIIDVTNIPDKKVLMQQQYSNMELDSSLLPDIINFLINQNIIDNKNVVYRNKRKPNIGASHNGFFWDAYAYTKTTGINTILKSNSKSDDKSTLVPIDTILCRMYSANDLQGFAARIQILLNSTKHGVRKILPILVYSTISTEALMKAKSLGYVTLNITSVFGSRVIEILNELKAIKDNELLASGDSAEFIDKIDHVMQSVVDTGQETNLSNIIGDLFESLILHLLKDVYSFASITPNKKLPNELEISKGKEFEYDFIIDTSYKEIVIVETKGYKSKSTIPLGDAEKKNTINWFFDNSFLSAKKHLKRTRDYPVKACYITTAKLDPEAMKKLENLNKGNLKPSKLDLFYDGEKLLQLIKTQGHSDLYRVLKRYYYKE